MIPADKDGVVTAAPGGGAPNTHNSPEGPQLTVLPGNSQGRHAHETQVVNSGLHIWTSVLSRTHFPPLLLPSLGKVKCIVGCPTVPSPHEPHLASRWLQLIIN